MSTPKKFAFSSEAAKRAYLALPRGIQFQFGNDLNAVQQGKRPMSDFEDVSSSVGAGAIELKENGSPAYRAIYCVKFEDTVFVLHAFTKTAQGTDKKNMDTAEARYKSLAAEVNERKRLAKRGAKQR